MQTVNVNLQHRVRPCGSFLWTFENAGRSAKVNSGEIAIVPAPGQNPRKVPGGLIHHWMGAMFLSNLKLNDVLEVTRDYDHYKEFYRPSVIESKVITLGNSNDQFSILFMNKALFLKTALDTDCQATNVRLDERHFYSISRTTRVQEVEEYGQPGEHRKPEGAGVEAIALSRDIPAAVHFVVDPIVRRVSRNSLLISLQQTEKAVCGRFSNTARSASFPVSAREVFNFPESGAPHLFGSLTWELGISNSLRRANTGGT